MERTPEPELMNDAEQVRAYAEADFAEPHDHFVRLFRERFDARRPARILDLGCGPGDIARRLARAFPTTHVVGLDGAPAMLTAGRNLNRADGLEDRIELRLGYLPDVELPEERFDAVISNSLLHHLNDPSALWSAVRRAADDATAIFVMDLMRPSSAEAAQALVDKYASDEPEILQRDFQNSLHAAYRPEEVREQLTEAGLSHLEVEPVSDRHFVAYGIT